MAPPRFYGWALASACCYTGTQIPATDADRIPQAVVAREDADRLARTIAAYPGKVRVRFNIQTRSARPSSRKTSLAKFEAVRSPTKWLFSELTSIPGDLGTGALDNGCNAAAVIEVAAD